MSFRPPPRWPRARMPMPDPAAENRRFFLEVCGRIDGSISREDSVSAADRALGEELWARIDGRYARHELEEEWDATVASVREVRIRAKSQAKK